MDADDDDFDTIDTDDVQGAVELDTGYLARAQRPRRNWRDIERLREQREIDRLLNSDSWFEDLDHL